MNNRFKRETGQDDRIKAEYAAEGRTYCRHCGNSDADMDVDEDICYDCKHPEESARNRQMDREDYFYTFGDGGY